MSTNLNYNRLKEAKSLYLKQNQDSPVHWWSYGPEAIDYAQKENKPIFLSIGYSASHWCQDMNTNCFKNEEIANFLNENFVNILVDREENPDLDALYQKAAQLYGHQGGWPLSAFLLPDMKPFFVGGHYVQKSTDNQSLPFINLLTELNRAYSQEKTQVIQNATQAIEAIMQGPPPAEQVKFEGHFPHPNGILQAVSQFADKENGGYGPAPKFPTYAYYEWAVEQMLEGMVDKEHGEFIIKSLENMIMGGMNDHARGGVHRYTNDEKWIVPNFEKMLYDQAAFLKTMTKLSLLYPSPLVFDSIINTLDYLENEMLSDVDSEGKRHFFSSQSSDSEGVEGLFFTFTENEFEDMLNANDNDQEEMGKKIDQIKKWFRISSKGNFTQGLNVISLDPALKEEIYQQQNWDLIRKVRRAILNERKERMPPMTDNKGVASWNFQLISALCDVVQYAQIDIIKQMASNLLNTSLEGVFKTFIENGPQGMKMKHSTTAEFSHPLLEDFIFFAESQLRLYEISGNEVFKQNFNDSMDFIAKEFLENDKLLTRAKFANEFELYPNQEANIFDTAFKSTAGTFIGLSRRASILFGDRDFEDRMLNLRDKVANTILAINPVSAGESLRALIYPKEAYRVIKMPRSWTQRPEFLTFTPYFLNRFVFSFHDTDASNEFYEICSHTTCEIKGLGLKEFIETLTPRNQE